MPTIKQLPAATAVSGSDLLPISQNGLTRSTTVSTLLSNTQPMLSLAQGMLIGRVSAGLGGPEAVSLGSGVALQAGAVIANGADHTSFAVATSLGVDDEVIINSAASPKRLPASKFRSIFTAGNGVEIDDSGVISITSTSTSSGSTVGPKGDPGPQGPAGQGFTFRGPWQAGTNYSAYDVVTSGGQTYIAANSVTAAATFMPTNWVLAAAQGGVGPAGPAGATGPAGPTTAATSGSIGAIKPGAGLSVTADGTLSIGNVALASIAQGTAAVGQILGWSGTTWTPTTPSAGLSYTGSAPIVVASGVVSLAQSNASIGQVLSWNGSAWAPATPVPPVSYTGAAPVTVTSGVISLAQGNASIGQVLTWNGSAWVPQFASSVVLGSATPVADGVAATGTASAASREDHRHPTDVTRAPISSPIFSNSITLPSWTTTTRPAAPSPGMEGFATDTSRRETFTSAGWVQYVRTSDLPVSSGQLLGSSSIPGSIAAITIGSGLSLVSGTLSASTPTSSAAVSGVSIDGSTISASVTAPYQMATSDRVVDVNKTSGAQTKILLPQNPTLWVDYTVIDGKGDAGTNNVTLSGASGVTINGQPSFVMNANNDAITLRAVSATVWRVA